MRQVFLYLPRRSPTMATTGPKLLLSLRHSSSVSSHTTPSPLCSYVTIQRLQHRAFHVSTPNHRKPPPIKIVKPQPKPKTFTPTYQPPKDDDTRHHQQQQAGPIQEAKPKLESKRSKWPSIAFIALLLLAFPPLITSTKTPQPLNQEKFTPFTITAREQVSPTAFILTLEPPAAAKSLLGSKSSAWTWTWTIGGSKSDSDSGRESADVIKRAWEHGLWSVEVKQPELQVARDYTPLPPHTTGDGEGEGDVKLRLYIRRMERGEVSGYLARLKVGDTVELRGPRLGFDLRRRVGVDEVGVGDGDGEREKEKKKVVFFAGGTGIAPALQAAGALLDHPEVEMQVVWANRRREDCVGCEGGEEKGAVVEMLEDFRRRYGERFRYSCTVDEEGSFIDAGAITRLAQVAPPAQPPAPARRSTWGLWSSAGGRDSPAVSPPAAPVNADDCSYHSAKKLVVSDEKDAAKATDGGLCQCKDIEGHSVKGGKNLLMFSGPDGFMAHYVGAKVWAGGKELQGPVKGVVGDLKRKYPSLGEDWLVLKM
jgi:ferredoxin-NADP reductase